MLITSGNRTSEYNVCNLTTRKFTSRRVNKLPEKQYRFVLEISNFSELGVSLLLDFAVEQCSTEKRETRFPFHFMLNIRYGKRQEEIVSQWALIFFQNGIYIK